MISLSSRKWTVKMPDLQHYCYACNVKLTVERPTPTEAVVSCPQCDFVRTYTFKSQATRQAEYRQRKQAEKPPTSLTIVPEGFIPKPLRPHAKTTRCPECRSKLTSVNLSPTTACKGCKACKRKFDYTRTDTPEGRAKRVQDWRLKRNVKSDSLA